MILFSASPPPALVKASAKALALGRVFPRTAPIVSAITVSTVPNTCPSCLPRSVKNGELIIEGIICL